MQSLFQILKVAATVPPEIRQRLMEHEGGYTKVIRDSGGVTRGGVAESSGMNAEQIRNLRPADIDKRWDSYWQGSGAYLKDPVAAEIALNYAGNAGQPTFAKALQLAINKVQPDQPPLPGTYLIGKQTQARLAALPDHSVLREPLIASLEERHRTLQKADPKTYGNTGGWAKRTQALRQLMQPQEAPIVSIQANRAPNLVKPNLAAPAVKTINPQPQVIKGRRMDASIVPNRTDLLKAQTPKPLGKASSSILQVLFKSKV